MEKELIPAKRVMDWLLLFLAPTLFMANILVSYYAPANDTIAMLAWATLVIEVLLLFVPAYLFIEKRGPHKFGRVKILPGEAIWSSIIGFGMFCLMAGVNGLTQAFFESIGMGWFASGSGDMGYLGGGWRVIAAVLLVGFIPAYVEETFFRGALMYAWKPYGVKKAVIHCALMFALIHWNPAALPALIAAGLVLGAVAAMSGSYYNSMVAHLVNNLLNVAALYTAGSEAVASAADTVGQLGYNELLMVGVLYFSLGAIIVFFSYRALRSAVRRRLIKERESALKQAKAAYGDSVESGAAFDSESAYNPAIVYNEVLKSTSLADNGGSTALADDDKNSKIMRLLTYGILVLTNAAVAAMLYYSHIAGVI